MKIDKKFLGIENAEGFNYPISEEKINLILIEKHNYIKELNHSRLLGSLNLIIIGFFYLVALHFQINQKYLYYGLFLMCIPTLILACKRRSKWELVWFKFLLLRNKELLENKNFKKQKWEELFF
jgi:hypothetical protein